MVIGQVPSDFLNAGQLRYTVPVPPDSSSALGQVPSDFLNAGQLRYTVPVPPDSSSALSPGRCATLLLTILIAAPGFVGERSWE